MIENITNQLEFPHFIVFSRFLNMHMLTIYVLCSLTLVCFLSPLLLAFYFPSCFLIIDHCKPHRHRHKHIGIQLQLQ